MEQTYYDANGIGAPINFKFTPDDAIVITGRAIFGSINGYAKIDLNGNHIWSYPSVSSLTIGDAEGDDFGNTYLVHGERFHQQVASSGQMYSVILLASE
ncbi:MAG: hypothetical protein MUE64_04910 [Ignavibacteriaceae bacterium]|nr:hypothetical protein [Ignavibacteriaceae bacterium]